MDERSQPTPQPPGPVRSGYQSFCLFAAWIIGILCIIDFVGVSLALWPLLESFFGTPYHPMTAAKLETAIAGAGLCALEGAGLLALLVIVLGMGRIEAHLSRRTG